MEKIKKNEIEHVIAELSKSSDIEIWSKTGLLDNLSDEQKIECSKLLYQAAILLQNIRRKPGKFDDFMLGRFFVIIARLCKIKNNINIHDLYEFCESTYESIDAGKLCVVLSDSWDVELGNLIVDTY